MDLDCRHLEHCPECQKKIDSIKKERDELSTTLNRIRRKATGPMAQAAEQVYDYYKEKLRAGGRNDAIKSIVRLIKDGAPLDLLYACIDRAKAQYKKEGRDSQYYPQANNFFGFKAYWTDFREPRGPEPEGDDHPDYVTDFGGHKRRVR